jgi:alpha-D-xyloside xylohydrolase
MFDETASRKVYLPPGKWIDYQTGKVYQGAQWHQIAPGQIPVVLLVKDHSVIPHIKVAQSTSQMDWNNVELRVFSADNATASGLFALPGGDLLTFKLGSDQSGFTLHNLPVVGKVKWWVTHPAMVTK